MSDSLQPNGLQHTRPPCPSPTPGAYSNSCSLSRWCHPAISSSIVPFSSCLQSFQASWSFKMSQFFTSGGQNIGLSASASVFPTNAAAAAKLLQLCPTLCDPIDSSPPGSPVPGILQARTLEWVAVSFSNASKWKMKGKPLSHVRLFTTPWTAAHQAPPFMGLSRQEYWSGLHCILNSNEYSGLISFRMDWLLLLAVQGTLKNLLQHHSSKASIFLRSVFFIVQLSHPYILLEKP